MKAKMFSLIDVKLLLDILCDYLWDNCEFRAQVMQAHLSDVLPIYADAAPCSFNDAEQGQGHGGLPSSRTTNNSHLDNKQMTNELVQNLLCITIRI